MHLKVQDNINQIKSSILASHKFYVEQSFDRKTTQVKQSKKYGGIENGLKTFKLNRRYLIVEISFTLLLLNYFAFVFTYYSMEVQGQFNISEILLWNLLISSIFGLSVCSYFRYLVRKQLAQGRRQRATDVKYLILQIFILLIQPYPGLNEQYMQRRDHQNQIINPLKINHFLIILSVIKVVFLIRGILIYITPYSNPRHLRVAKIYGAEHSYVYHIRCLFRDHPVASILTLYFVSLFFFAYFYKILQFGIENNHSLDYFQNSLWLAMISMTSVGYGDNSPKSVMGGYMTVLSSFVGVIGISLFVLSITNNLELNYRQERVLQILRRFKSHRQIKMKSAQLIAICLSRKWKKHKYNQIAPTSGLQRQLKRQLLNLRMQSRKVLKQSSLLQQVMQQQFQIARHHIDSILNNCQLILHQCSKKQQIIDGVLKDMYKGKQKQLKKMGFGELLGIDDVSQRKSINISPITSMHRVSSYI